MPHRRVFSDPISDLPRQEREQLALVAERIDPPTQFPTSEDNKEEQSGETNVSQSTSQAGSATQKRSINNYQLIKTLGSGSMGKVKLGLHSTIGEKVAIKIIPRTSSDGKKRSKKENREVRVVREAAIMSLLNHPNIVKMKEVVVRPSHYYLIMEYISGGQLLDYIISHGKLKEKHARRFIRQIISAIDYCHQNSIVHRDLKIENILIASDGSIKIIDFGLSNLFSPQSQLSTFCGSLYFAAPELLSAKAYTGPEVDIWSIGIILYVLVCGQVPFDDQNQPALHAKIKRGRINYPSWLSAECKHLISRMLNTKPSDRATMTEILRHPWISKGYDGPPNSYVPYRTPLQLPLDMDIVRGMAGFELGDESHIKEELENLISSEAYQNQKSQTSVFKLPSSLGGYLKKYITIEEKPFGHPLLSIYYLAKEKLDRERLRQEKLNAEYHSLGACKTSNTDISHTIERDQHVPAGYETSLAEIRKAAANYFASLSRATTTEGSSQPAEPAREEPPIIRRRNHSTTGGVLRRLSQVIKPGRNFRNGSNNEPAATERHLSPIYETSNVEHSPEQAPKTSGTCVQTEEQPLSPQKSSRRKSKLIWFHTHSRKMDEESPATPSCNRESPGRTDAYVKPVFLKGLFSVATTSTKKPEVIRADVIRVLDELGYAWQENFDCFECTQIGKPSMQRSPSTSDSSSSCTDSTKLRSPQESDSSHASECFTSRSISSGSSSEYPESKTSHSVKFQISIVKIPWLLGLCGVRFRRISGHPWEYRDICKKVLHKLNL
ncbi:Pkinase-domain-containing protein [Basidiobolus meristosporus CBS 931.73]|uniref:non-specific serine/threonine protein kinase n=1 Tax=Basidiobolus meristosporus CBS 931.73 TaxID=1314790 RepID=A0A1Y1Y1L9_9FUNG|nr:Pkinase-domain-containing protein [Basidiobolus meristosporus CBS 931.73]|eukprot:ORX91524.1 Pkinase-domain-containing protein [Basidiobolus meristosporus CBS 931.73]